MKAVANTFPMVKKQSESESGGTAALEDEEASAPPDKNRRGGAALGDLVQWESNGALQFESPKRVRWVSDDGEYLAVVGSETGIPMSEVISEASAPLKAPPAPPPLAPLSSPDITNSETAAKRDGFTEWFKVKVGPDKLVSINYRGEGDIGPREIEKMIAILTAQKLALED